MSRQASRVLGQHDLQTMVLGPVVQERGVKFVLHSNSIDILSNTFHAIGKRDPRTSSSSSVCVNQKEVLAKIIIPRVSTGTHLYQFAPI
jgi:hypothetical protein